MATANNIAAQPALNGQSVLVTFSAADAATYFPTLTVGQSVSTGTPTKTGTISKIYSLQNVFKVTPAWNSTRFDDANKGILNVDAVITF